MIPYCRQLSDITFEHLLLLDQVRSLVNILPDHLTCHQVCDEVVKQFPELEKVTGYFGFYGAEHSWCLLWGTKVVIDPYPIAVASGPILLTLEGSAANAWNRIYQEIPCQTVIPSLSVIDEPV
jgi:hypothetical protein